MSPLFARPKSERKSLVVFFFSIKTSSKKYGYGILGSDGKYEDVAVI